MLRAPESVGRTEGLQNCARDGKRQASLDAGEGNLRAEPNGLNVLRLFRPCLDLARRMLVGRTRRLLPRLALRFLGVDPGD